MRNFRGVSQKLGRVDCNARRQQVQRQRRFGDLKSESGIYHLLAVKIVLVNDP